MAMFNFNLIILSDRYTLPKDVLIPDFTGNAEYIDEDDVFAPTQSRKDMWINGFPNIERPPDELVYICNMQFT